MILILSDAIYTAVGQIVERVVESSKKSIPAFSILIFFVPKGESISIEITYFVQSINI